MDPLDHKKGFAEAHLGRLVEQRIRQPENFLETELDVVIAQIRSIETQHDECVEEMASLRERILNDLNAVIEMAA